MSRIGKKPIVVPENVDVKIDGQHISVSGPKGKLEIDLHPQVFVSMKDRIITFSVANPENSRQGALWGLMRSLVKNMVDGVVTEFSKKLEIVGIGFKAEVKKDELILNVGYSHQVHYKVPKGIEIKVEKNIIIVSGADKHSVGQTSAEIRSIKKPEPYKGKGIKYVDEIVKRKAGKAVVKSE
ncbi:MAG: 50S ribosomal protein L6 [Parcubacteria group bacterium GW2011_GWA2_38_13]|nr:MAG: 50S ribosomal protein L6 [Parcubacteria group bacterium GW2011_GWA2_38_13]